MQTVPGTQCAVLLYFVLTEKVLAGFFDMMTEATSYVSRGHILQRIVPAVTAALQAYQMRAAQSGQSFMHMVLLEAAVQGWHVTTLLLAIYILALMKHACTVARRHDLLICPASGLQCETYPPT